MMHTMVSRSICQIAPTETIYMLASMTQHSWTLITHTTHKHFPRKYPTNNRMNNGIITCSQNNLKNRGIISCETKPLSHLSYYTFTGSLKTIQKILISSSQEIMGKIQFDIYSTRINKSESAKRKSNQYNVISMGQGK